MIKNRRPVLRAEIGALPVQLRGIVVLPENVEQVSVRNFSRIIFNFNGLGMSGAVGANVFVSWVLKVSTDVTNAGSGYAGNLAERRFNTPKTPCCKNSFCHIHTSPSSVTIRCANIRKVSLSAPGTTSAGLRLKVLNRRERREK